MAGAKTLKNIFFAWISTKQMDEFAYPDAGANTAGRLGSSLTLGGLPMSSQDDLAPLLPSNRQPVRH